MALKLGLLLAQLIQAHSIGEKMAIQTHFDNWKLLLTAINDDVMDTSEKIKTLNKFSRDLGKIEKLIREIKTRNTRTTGNIVTDITNLISESDTLPGA